MDRKVRQTRSEEQFYDVNYSDLSSNPVETVRNIYNYFGYPYSPEMEKNLHQWITNNPKHKHGVHRYSLEQFGLDKETVNAQFSEYCKRFNIAVS